MNRPNIHDEAIGLVMDCFARDGVIDSQERDALVCLEAAHLTTTAALGLLRTGHVPRRVRRLDPTLDPMPAA